MFKIYKRLKKKDWLIILLILCLTFFQVFFTMKVADYVKKLTLAISYLNYHNHPEELGQIADFIKYAIGIGWNNIPQGELAMFDSQTLSELKQTVNASVGNLWSVGGLMMLYALTSTVFQAFAGVFASRLASDISYRLRNELYLKIDKFGLEEINRFQTGSLITRLTNDVVNVQNANVVFLRIAMASPITAIWAIVKIQTASFSLTMSTSVTVVILVLCISAMLFAVLPKIKKVQLLTDEINTVSRENLTGIRVIRAYNCEKYQEDKFEDINNRIVSTQLKAGSVMSLLNPFINIIFNGAILAVYWIGAHLISKGEMEFATISSFVMLTSQVIMSFMYLMFLFMQLPSATVSAKRINEVLDTEIKIESPTEVINTKTLGEIEFKNVSFKYPGADANVISNISFKAKKGDTVAFIGTTGSGKSTIVNLIPRFYDATSGEILVDGVNIKDLSLETIRDKVSYVPQKAYMFSGTIKENMQMGNEDITDENINKAIDISMASEFVNNLDDKLLSRVSQGGKNFSGGQRQRLCIARALARNPEIVIFDDSFSALDYKTDRLVRQNINKQMEGVTKLIVAQRIGTIMDANLIVVLEHGQIVGCGTHQTLLQDCDIYREIALSQLSKEELGL